MAYQRNPPEYTSRKGHSHLMDYEDTGGDRKTPHLSLRKLASIPAAEHFHESIHPADLAEDLGVPWKEHQMDHYEGALKKMGKTMPPRRSEQSAPQPPGRRDEFHFGSNSTYGSPGWR